MSAAVKRRVKHLTCSVASSEHAAITRRARDRELTLRSLQHGAALGRAGDSTAAAVLADELAEYR